MLDLDALAEKYAKALDQKEDDWRKAVWSPSFQTMSQSMSDGEIENFLANCTSVTDIDSVLVFLQNHPERDRAMPYALLIREAQNIGVGLRDWIEILSGGTRT